MIINGQTKVVGFLGSTYKTSKMYRMYNAAFKALGLNYVYIPFVISDLKKAVEGIRNLGFHAVGVTIPYKIEIVKFLDKLDENAKRIGAVNAVINSNGKLIGYNTDGLGAVKAIREKKAAIKNKKILILGAGGAAKSITIALNNREGKVTVLNRKNLSTINSEIKDTDILINATPVGMSPEINSSLVAENLLFSHLTVMDIITNPKETRLLLEAKKKGCNIIYGERMLFWQAVLKFKLFTGVDAPLNVMERELYA